MAALEKSDAKIAASVLPTSSFEVDSTPDTQEERRSLRHRFREVIWDSWDRSPEERKFVSKIDFFILTWAGFTYFSKNLNQNNLSNAYVSGMKEEINVVGNQYQTFTTMWTIGYVISQIPSQMVTTRVRLSWWCPSWELFWVIVTFATAAVKTPHQVYACRFLVGFAEGTFYPAVHTVLGGCVTLWQACPVADENAGKQLDEPITWVGVARVLKKWHFWVYTAYYTFFICSENIGGYMNLWLKALIVTTLCYGWVSDGIGLRSPIVYFSLTVCFFAAMNLAVWDGVPFGLKWASFYLTGFAQGSGPVFLTMVNEICAGDSLERKLILGSTNSIAYAFNAWIPLITYDTNYAPRF
ncbi:unnamed protein product [Aureobasidium pullulans]|nr:unnamed protein product [Aureobasidium pullulans]